MHSKHKLALAALFGIAVMVASQLAAQAPAPAAGGRGRGRGAAAGAVGASGAAAGRGGGGGGSYPSRPPADPAVAARGKAIWDPNCSRCHAVDMRGTTSGVNLVHNQLVMDDQNGELIAKLVQNTHAKGQAAKMDLNADQIHDLSIYMHTFMNYRTIVMPPDINGAIMAVGDAKAGEAYFNGAVGKCNTCHSVTGDLKGIGTKYSEPRTMQNTLVAGGGGGGGRGGGGRGGGADPAAADAASRRIVTVTVTMPNGTKYEGRQIARDDFLVTVLEADGTQRTIRRNGDVPKVEVHDPMKAHRDLLLVLKDEDIHNLTAYLVSVK